MPIRSASKFLLLAAGLAVFGNGLLSTAAALRLADSVVTEALAGGLLAAYFAGLVVGTLGLGATIERVGSVRAFSAFTALSVIASIAHGLIPPGGVWLLLRGLNGVAMAGFYMTVESWLTSSSDSSTRGRVLSLYLVAIYVGLALGQFCLPALPLDAMDPFAIAALCASAAGALIALAPTQEPQIEAAERLRMREVMREAPLGWIGAWVAGFVAGAIYTSFPLMMREAGRSPTEVTTLMGLTLVGGLLGQWPIGVLSDRVDRRLALMATSGGLVLVCLAAPAMASASGRVLSFFAVPFGALAFSIYPLAVAHALDRLPQRSSLAAVAQLLLASSIGSVIGPIVSSAASAQYGSGGYFAVNAGVLGLLVCWGAVRVARFEPAAQEPYQPIPRTSPVIAELDPRVETVEPGADGDIAASQ